MSGRRKPFSGNLPQSDRDLRRIRRALREGDMEALSGKGLVSYKSPGTKDLDLFIGDSRLSLIEQDSAGGSVSAESQSILGEIFVEHPRIHRDRGRRR